MKDLNEENEFNYKEMKTVFLNKKTVFKDYQSNPQKEDSNSKIVKH